MSRLCGGLIDREKAIQFTFNGTAYTGHYGDTLASALLANGVQLVGRSFKYHRPRGIFSAGSEEPNALVTIRDGAHTEPNTNAATVELFEGLVARSQNNVGSLERDLLSFNDRVAPFFAAGFYYKTFMWPRAFWERVYEPAIRKAAGLGALSMLPDPDEYDKGFLHCELLVIGGGAAGLAAALTAGRAGARVILVNDDFRLGGRLLLESDPIDDAPAADWVATVEDELESLSNVRIMPRTTVFGVYDHGIYGAVERVADHLPEAGHKVRQTLWRITAKRAVLAAGAIERHIPFADNDRPGIMLGGAMRAYVNRWAAAPVRSRSDTVAVFTNGDDGHRTALDMIAKGIDVLGVIDTRADARKFGDYRLIANGTITGTRGRLGLKAIQISSDGKSAWHNVGALAVSGGWNPNIHLASQHGGRPVWKDDLLAFVPGERGPRGMIAAGAAMGRGSATLALKDGMNAALSAVSDLGIDAQAIALPTAEDRGVRQAPFWHAPGTKRAWVDFQNDVTVKDIVLSAQENMRSVEHLKRWTTLGMATDQGKTSNVSALAVMAELTGRTIPQVGTTMFRPPYTGVSLSALGGGDTGTRFRPRRLTPTHVWAKAQGAEFVEIGLWMRAQYFPKSGETHWRQAVDREVNAVRRGVGFCDVSTLGKIDVQGTGAREFLNRVYANTMETLKVGRVRYGLMLREDGHVFDDGTCARLDEHQYVVTTTTANAGAVYRNLEFARQCLWPELDVHLISTTDAWAQIAVAGPNSRELLSRIVDDLDISNDALPFMGCCALTACGGLRARLFRISFSGELAYEIAVPARYANALMERLMERGSDLYATPYGTEALGVMRIEKGHAAGAELNGQTTATMLGLARMVSHKKDAIGAIMSRREGLAEDERRLVGLKPLNPHSPVPAGAHLFTRGDVQNLQTDQGWITSACYSPSVGSHIALGYLENGDTRMGEVIIAANPIERQNFDVEVLSPCFVDPEGGRLRD
ncbi:sarcosine oxidase subunit alpha family protein [Marivita sp. S2033]|uniref:sarcosine oxidase subunit alpha family protein n=1 Tax=Marivita sp. S2033 TaxID=3373187 RepID=UPI003982224C